MTFSRSNANPDAYRILYRKNTVDPDP
jgi:hypothetical protein